MENKARYTLVGFFILIFTIAMVVFILWLARYDIEEINSKEYRVYTSKSIAGLHENSIVEYKGLNIGTVDKIQINPKNLEQIEVILKITKPELVKIDSFAIVQSQGVTGNKIIEIDGGTNSSKLLELSKEGYAVIPLKKSFFDKITNSADNITVKIESVLTKFEKILNEDNIEHIGEILENLDSSSKNFDTTMNNVNTLINKQLVSTLENLSEMTKSIDKLVKNDVSKTIKKIDDVSTNFNQLNSDVQTLINNDVKSLINELRNSASSTQDIEKVITQLESTLERVDTTVEEFGQNGGNMIFQTRDIKYGPGEK